MAGLVARYLNRALPLTVLDVGSFDVNGSYRPLFNSDNWRYVGIDLASGPNVDIVLQSPYRLPFADRSADVIISGQAFEHIEFFWLTWLEIARVVKAGGLIFLIAPSRGPEHRFPVDCWRYYPDGYTALAKYAELEVVSVGTDWAPDPDSDSAQWGDTVGVFRKPVRGLWSNARSTVVSRLRRTLLLPGR